MRGWKAALAAIGVAWCGGASAQTLTMGVQASFGIDPHFIFLGPNMAAARHVFDTLVDRDAESRWTPGLTQSWTPIQPQVWEFRLRQGVTFQDGTPFTADDVVFSFERIPNIPGNPGPYTPNLRGITRVEVVDAHTLRLHTASPNPVLPGQMTNVFIVSRRAAEGAAPSDFASGRAAIGTGPFRLEQFRGSDGMSVTRYDNYWGQRPEWQRVNIRVIPNDAARMAALLAGDVDLIEEVPTGDVQRLQASGRVSVFRQSSDRVIFLLPHVGAERLPLITDAEGRPLDHNPFRDIRVREALSLAVNRAALVERAMDGAAIATGQLVPEGFGGWDPGIPVPPNDPARARRLLAEAGYPNGFGFTLACPNNRYVNDARVCQALGQMFTRAGFHARIETQPGSVYFARTAVGRNDVPLVFFGQSSSSTRDATHVLSLAMHSQQLARGLGQSNRGAFSDPNLDSLIQAAAFRMEGDREAALRTAMREAMRLHAGIPLYTQMVIAAARTGIVYTPRLDEQTVAIHARRTN
ncbi:ABC transporter substrate-binding protein [Falsiroseomonas oryzae]|uniref:ABC transporter substrate-binding protein n=1 Tax=Falsiroseomonas oryzae TaxID=2766473 RepID=UPI0022EA55F8|nr:ABC transporter substrate-binding protein [Roseomonas sp. MO-31]